MEVKKENNYAFIDTQNVLKGTDYLGWSIDWAKFRIYLKNKYHISKAFLFLGYIARDEKTYQELKDMGYELIFKQIYIEGKNIKANIDVELAMQVILERDNFDYAVIVSSDGDFHSLIKYLMDKSKYKICLAILPERCSIMIRKITASKIAWIKDLRKLIEYVNENRPQGDVPV